MGESGEGFGSEGGLTAFTPGSFFIRRHPREAGTQRIANQPRDATMLDFRPRQE